MKILHGPPTVTVHPTVVKTGAMLAISMRRALPLLMMLAAGTAWADPFAAELAARRARFLKEGARPQAALALCGLLDLWDQLADRAPLVAFLDEAVASKAAPEVRARAGYLRSLVLERQGRSEEAGKRRAQLGLIDRFMVVGPFDTEG